MDKSRISTVSSVTGNYRHLPNQGVFVSERCDIVLPEHPPFPLQGLDSLASAEQVILEWVICRYFNVFE